MSNNKYKVLVIEDETNIQSFLQTILETNGYQVVTADTCKKGMMMFVSYYPDLVVLDLGLPDRDGTEFIKEIRRDHSTPILVLSARSDEGDKVSALELGANDYVTKPFGTAEFLARVKVAIRNNRILDARSAKEGKFTVWDMQVNYDTRQVTILGNEIKLTQTEYNILALLCQYAGKVLTYSEIIKEIWGFSDDGAVKKLQVNMANLRKKLGCKPGDNRYIINELGVGYRINNN